MVSDFLNQVVADGPVAVRRGDYYANLVAEGWSTKDADAIAFGYARRCDECNPLSCEDHARFRADPIAFLNGEAA